MAAIHEVSLGGAAFWEQLSDNPARLAAQVCLIDVHNMDRTLQRHASLRAWVNAQHETARVEEERAKWELTKTRARVLLQDVRMTADSQTGKTKTKDVAEAEVELHDDVVACTEALLTAQQKRGALRAMADALEDRKDMLVQIAAKNRREQEDN